MKSLKRIVTLTTAVFAMSGCAAHSAAHSRAHCHKEKPPAAPSRSIDLPGKPAAGEPQEMNKLLDGPGLKLASIVLRGGTVLPTHQAPMPVTILALQGSGTVVAGADRFRLDSTHAVYLAPNVAHSVEPDSGTDLVLLVHHLGGGAPHREAKGQCAGCEMKCAKCKAHEAKGEDPSQACGGKCAKCKAHEAKDDDHSPACEGNCAGDGEHPASCSGSKDGHHHN